MQIQAKELLPWDKPILQYKQENKNKLKRKNKFVLKCVIIKKDFN